MEFDSTQSELRLLLLTQNLDCLLFDWPNHSTDPLESFSVKIEHPHYGRDVIVARRDSIRHVLLLTDVCLGIHLSFDGVRLSEDSDIISVEIPPNSMPAGLCLSRLASLKITSSSYTNTMSVLSSVKQIAHVAVLVRSHEAIIKFYSMDI